MLPLPAPPRGPLLCCSQSFAHKSQTWSLGGQKYIHIRHVLQITKMLAFRISLAAFVLLFVELSLLGDKGPKHHKSISMPFLSLQFSSQRKV